MNVKENIIKLQEYATAQRKVYDSLARTAFEAKSGNKYFAGAASGYADIEVRCQRLLNDLETLPPATPAEQIKCHVANCLCHPVCGKDTRCS